MIEARPDWCLSRQRVWGVPIPAFRCDELREAICSTPRSSSTWPTSSRARARTPGSRGRRPSCCPRRRLPARAAGREFDKQHDIVDVWFESGVSWAAVAEGKLVPAGREGRPLPRGRRPAPRLVPLVAADRRRRRAARRPTRRCSRTAGCSTSAARSTRSRRSRKARAARRQDRLRRSRRSGWRRTAPSCCASGRRPATTRATSSSRRRSSTSSASRTARSATPAATCCRTSTTSSRRAIALEDHELRELDLLALGVLRERDHQIFEAYRRYAFHEVVRLMNDYVDHACRPSTSTRSRTRSTARRPRRACGAACRPRSTR